MPRATIDINEVVRKELKTLPEGYVVLKRMSYGKYLDRQSEAMMMKAQQGQNRGDQEMELKMMGRKTALLEFKECIVEHNLEDAEGNLLNFQTTMWPDLLDPRIGQEIGDYLNELNAFEARLGE
jgi:hypothetical protein